MGGQQENASINPKMKRSSPPNLAPLLNPATTQLLSSKAGEKVGKDGGNGAGSVGFG